MGLQDGPRRLFQPLVDTGSTNYWDGWLKLLKNTPSWSLWLAFSLLLELAKKALQQQFIQAFTLHQRMLILECLIEDANITHLVRDYLEECNEAVQEVKRERMEIKRELKKIAESKLQLEREENTTASDQVAKDDQSHGETKDQQQVQALILPQGFNARTISQRTSASSEAATRAATFRRSRAPPQQKAWATGARIASISSWQHLSHWHWPLHE